jgi:hypothetical protein
VGKDKKIMQRKHAELIKAWADGAEIEQGIKTADGKIYWTTPKLVTWRDNQIYRIKTGRLNIMTTFTTEDRMNASPPHIVDSGASPKTLADFIQQENRVEILKEHMYKLYEEINRLRGENAKLRNEVNNLMDGRC